MIVCLSRKYLHCQATRPGADVQEQCAAMHTRPSRAPAGLRLCSARSGSCLPQTHQQRLSAPCRRLHRDRRRVEVAAYTQFTAENAKYVTASGLPDYYEILGVDDDATQTDIKSAYRSLAMTCHPDIAGEQGHNICILLNEAYSALGTPAAREKYNLQLEQALQDEDDDFTGEPLSHWCAGHKNFGKNEDPNETRAVFVDEVACIGCKQCVWIAQGTFRIEPHHGRSRAFAQWVDTEDDIQAAISSCPVECIYWVEKDQLPALEYVMQREVTERPNVGVMMSGQGDAVPDVFNATVRYVKKRQEKIEAREQRAKYSRAQDAARRRAADELRASRVGNQPWWERMTAGFANLGAMAASYVEVNPGEGKVGTRKRSRQTKGYMADDLSDGLGTIPLERSLVLSSSGSSFSEEE